ncbi:MAG: M2 family metallopeptidase [Sedimentisphaerales bacterium]|nr:M2 family metallopeptidase [Sedimentisphaerales bacterium]
MKTLLILFITLTAGILIWGCAPRAKQNNFEGYITSHVEKVKPLAKEQSLAGWDAATTGKSEDYERASKTTLKIRRIYSNPAEFALLKNFKESGQVKDPLTARQLDVLYRSYLENQIEPDMLKEIVDLSTEIEEKFSTSRGTIRGEKVTDNEIKEILKTQTNSDERKLAWTASKQVGAAVAEDIIRLVKLRNQAAKNLGFENYHTMTLAIGEQDVNELDKIFAELYELTNAPFAALKADLDQKLAANCGIEASELMPWHYHDPFFQETPMVYELDLDVYYKNKDIKKLAANFYAGIGLNVESVLAKSDLYEREGKNPHAFCTDIDREGDVRILCNIKSNESWMETTLHELGHAVYDKYHDPEVPYLLREPAHAFTTEAVAMFFGRLSRNPAWMQQMLDLSDEQRRQIEKVSGKYMQLKQLIFARWAMVMYNFEKQLYAVPDQDLNSLWWDMVEKYQLIRRPEGRDTPDWAAKIHFTIAPCYYHNYMLGELLASQLHNHLVHKVLKLESDKNVSYVSQKKAGDFLRKKVLEVGDVYHWNTMIKQATGEQLTPKYFVSQFVN